MVIPSSTMKLCDPNPADHKPCQLESANPGNPGSPWLRLDKGLHSVVCSGKSEAQGRLK